MGKVVLVRHAQASFFGASYDELSALGREQARALGVHLARHGDAVERVYIGPRRRHRQTCEIVAAAFLEQGLPFPAPTLLPELDEHAGVTVVKHHMGRRDLDTDAMHPGAAEGPDRERIVREFFRHYLEVMRDWARGSVVVPDVEPWAEFRARSLRALDRLCADGGTGRSLAFTSGGTVSSTAGWLLGLDDDRIIDLSVVLRNTALTEVSHSGRRRSLVTFNELPHLTDRRAATAV